MARGKDKQSPSNEVAQAEGFEQQVIAFAEQLGRVVGTVQAKAEGWLDQNALREQVTHIRDSAAALLEQLGATKTAAPKPQRTRSRGTVDAPGKKQRKPKPNVPLRASAADKGRVAKMKAVNSKRRRGRG